jgi:hypothetical protein
MVIPLAMADLSWSSEQELSSVVNKDPNPDFEKRILALGEEIFRQSAGHQMGLFEKGFWSGKMMEWSMQYPEFKTELFRFVDVLPTS